jgi:hypothetical protein
MATENIKVHSGNRVEIKFDGKTIGLLQNVSISDSYNPEPASGIGDIHAVEYVPTMAQHTITAGSMVLRNENLRAAGIMAENGDDILRGNVFDIVIYAKSPLSGVLRTYTGCSFASGQSTVVKHGILTMDATFNALDAKGVGL